jgi:hypothetical protein
VKGSGDQIEERLRQLSWVTQTSAARQNGATTWQVGVSDDVAAEAHLLRHILADEAVVVTEFSRKKYKLEEAFMDIVKGDHDGR